MNTEKEMERQLIEFADKNNLKKDESNEPFLTYKIRKGNFWMRVYCAIDPKITHNYSEGSIKVKFLPNYFLFIVDFIKENNETQEVEEGKYLMLNFEDKDIIEQLNNALKMFENCVRNNSLGKIA